MTEYIIVVGLIAIGCIFAVRTFGGKLGETMVGTENAQHLGLVGATNNATTIPTNPDGTPNTDYGNPDEAGPPVSPAPAPNPTPHNEPPPDNGDTPPN
jgi:hypothetical protein